MVDVASWRPECSGSEMGLRRQGGQWEVRSKVDPSISHSSTLLINPTSSRYACVCLVYTVYAAQVAFSATITIITTDCTR